MSRGRGNHGFTLTELVVVVALIAILATALLTRGDHDAFLRQELQAEEGKIEAFSAHAFSLARSHNEPVELTASTDALAVRGKYTDNDYGSLMLHHYVPETTGLIATVYPSGRLDWPSNNCNNVFGANNHHIQLLLSPGRAQVVTTDGTPCRSNTTNTPPPVDTSPSSSLPTPQPPSGNSPPKGGITIPEDPWTR